MSRADAVIQTESRSSRNPVCALSGLKAGPKAGSSALLFGVKDRAPARHRMLARSPQLDSDVAAASTFSRGVSNILRLSECFSTQDTPVVNITLSANF